MFDRLTPDRVLGLLVFVFAVIVLFLWIPADVESGYVDRVRRSYVMGDALAPTFAGVLLALAGLWLLLAPGGETSVTLDRRSVAWCVSLFAILLGGLMLIRWVGPALVGLLGDGEYRLLRDTVPWKYAGFLVGGTVITGGLTCLIEGRFSWRRIGVAFLAVLVMALLYDLPFEDLQLPPNGDV